MNLVFFAHPTFIGHQSMPRFAKMLVDGMAARGHKTEVWSPDAVFSKIRAGNFIRKWLGYIDQYIVFPNTVSRRIKQYPKDTLYVFTDQALGPWVPPFSTLPHAIHCHDFMALQSALGEVPENPIGWTGKQYQKLIQRGFSKGRHFISVSHKTRNDLQRYLPGDPKSSDVVYNGFHQSFSPSDPLSSRALFGNRINTDLAAGYILHVGGNLWYKNRLGVLEIYEAWRNITTRKTPLILIGESPSQALLEKQKSSKFAKDIHWLSGVEDQFVRHAYSGATLFLFPSLGEGFGWPIAEAMASGTPVITTGEAPMTEVGGTAAFFIPRTPVGEEKRTAWAKHAAVTVEKIVSLPDEERNTLIQAGIENAKRFDTQKALDRIEKIYSDIVTNKK